MSVVVFESARLLARWLEPGDRLPMLEVYGDAEAMRWDGNGAPLTAAQCERWLEGIVDNYRRRGPRAAPG